MPFLTLRSPVDILVAIPYLMGFHPTDSYVVVGVRAGQLHFHVRGDLPDPDVPGTDVVVAAAELADLFLRHRVEAVLLLGYGTPEACERILPAIEQAMWDRDVEVLDLLHVADGRYRSMLCRSADCCPPEGRPYGPAESPVAADAVVAGLVALPDRATVVHSLDPPTGDALDEIVAVTARVGATLAPVLAGDPAVRESAGMVQVVEALERYAVGDRLTDEELARLTLLLTDRRVRDMAWELADGDLGPGGPPPHEPTGDERVGIDPVGGEPAGAEPLVAVVPRQARGHVTDPDRAGPADPPESHVLLWTDVVRRCDPSFAAAPGLLLGYTMWRLGDCVRASAAVDRALAADPDYEAALLMEEVLSRGLPPSKVRSGSELPPGRRRPGRGGRRRRR